MGEAAEYDRSDKDMVRKRGRTLLKKSIELAELGRVFVAAVYWDPTHKHCHVAARLPEGETIPDLNRLVCTTQSIDTGTREWSRGIPLTGRRLRRN